MHDDYFENEVDKEPTVSRKDLSQSSFYKSAEPFDNIALALSEEDFSPAIMKIVLAENMRLKNDINKLKVFEENYHRLDKEVARLNEYGKTFKFTEFLYTLAMAVGTLLVGMAPGMNSKYGWYNFYIGIALFICGGLAKIFIKERSKRSEK